MAFLDNVPVDRLTGILSTGRTVEELIRNLVGANAPGSSLEDPLVALGAASGGPGFVVAPPGDVTLAAVNRIALADGFAVEEGGKLAGTVGASCAE